MGMREIPHVITKHRCRCGALRRAESARRCSKCSERAYWHRRKAWRTRKSPDRYRIGKK
jgi:hypothetical protein